MITGLIISFIWPDYIELPPFLRSVNANYRLEYMAQREALGVGERILTK
jgi:hypothetical protein